MKFNRHLLVMVVVMSLITQLSTLQSVSAQDQLTTQVTNVVWNPQRSNDLVAFAGRAYSADYKMFKQFLMVRKTSDMSVLLDLSATLGGINQQVRSIDWSPDGKYLVAAISDGVIKVWNVTERSLPIGQTIAEFNTNSGILQDVKWSPNGKWLVSLTYGQSISIWNVNAKYSLVDTLTLNTGYSLSWNPQGTGIAVTGDIGVFICHISSDGQFIPSDLYQFTKQEQPFMYPGNPVWNSTGSQIAFVDRQTNIIHIYDIVAKNEVRTLATNGVLMLTWSPDDSWFAYFDGDWNVRVSDSLTGKELVIYQTRRDGGLANIVWSADGNRLAYSGNYDAAAIVTLPSTTGDASSLVTSPPILLLSGQPAK